MKSENSEGISYEHDIGLNLVPEVSSQNSNHEILQKVNKDSYKTQLKQYEQLIPSSAVRPPLTAIPFDPLKTYKSILFDIETTSTTKN